MAEETSPQPPYDPCPCEMCAPAGAPSAVADGERLIRAVQSKDDLIRDGEGRLTIAPAKFRKSDLTEAGRSVSVFRDLTPETELRDRLVSLNKEDDWQKDPVRAIASVAELRAASRDALRLLCVYAEPIEDNLGECRTHAGVRRSKPVPDLKNQVEMLIVRTALSNGFRDICHLSGALVATKNAP